VSEARKPLGLVLLELLDAGRTAEYRVVPEGEHPDGASERVQRWYRDYDAVVVERGLPLTQAGGLLSGGYLLGCVDIVPAASDGQE
jgi:hypothetical protein